MSIDTGLSITYNPNFPIPGINQDSKAFRDNFQAIKFSIENLQSATEKSGSIFSVNTSVGSNGLVTLDLQYAGNAFRLPSGEPSIAATAGMIRYQSGTIQFHDGSGWRNAFNEPIGIMHEGIVLADAAALDFRGGVEVTVVDGVARISVIGIEDEEPTPSLTVENNGVDLSPDFYVDTINFTGPNINVSQTGSRVTVALQNTVDAPEVRSIIGSFIDTTMLDENGDPFNTGITATLDSTRNKLVLGHVPFTISLSGAVAGSATVSKFGNVNIATTAPFIQGITAFDEGISLGGSQSVREIDFTGGGVWASQVGNRVIVNVPAPLTAQDVRDQIGTTVKGTVRNPDTQVETETGITVNYDQSNNTVEIGVREFDITLTGAVAGTGRVSRLNNVTINTTTDLIKGLNVLDEGVATGLSQSVKSINFTGGAVAVTQVGSVATVNIPQGLTDSDVRDEVGSFLRSTIVDPQTQQPTESGITVNYDPQNEILELGVREFDINLAGAVTGTARVRRLNSVTINTTTDLIKGIDARKDSTPLGAAQSIKTINFTGSNITASQAGDILTVSVAEGLTLADVRNDVGALVKGGAGINVTYSAPTTSLTVAAEDFNLTLTGDINGTATVTGLGDTTIATTSTTLIKGLNVLDEGIATGAAQSVKSINFTGGGVTATQIDNTVTVNVPASLTSANVRDEVGALIKGSIRNTTTNVITSSGINVNYDAAFNRLELSPRAVTYTLTGRVTGTATQSNLGDVTIATSTTAIDGLTLRQNGVLVGATEGIKTINLVGSNFTTTLNGSMVDLTVNSEVSAAEVRSIASAMAVGSHNGLTASYDSSNQKLSYALKPIEVAITGAVQGTGTITFTGSNNDGKVTIATDASSITPGIEIRDEGATKGIAIAAINFVGGGVTSSVTVDGQVATVFVPNSPGNEKFLLIDNGSQNAPNSRKITAGSGITFNDGGPGGDFTISANSDSIIAKSQIALNGALIAERAKINLVTTQQVFIDIDDDTVNNKVDIRFYSLMDGWFRQSQIDCGSITDKYGNSIDMGSIRGGIIEHVADMGTLI